MDSYLSRLEITLELKRFSRDFHRGTILHARKDFAVSPPLKELVSVLTYILADCGRYPLRLIRKELRVRTFLPGLATRATIQSKIKEIIAQKY